MKYFNYSKETITLINLYNKLYQIDKSEIAFEGLGTIKNRVDDNLLLASLFLLIEHTDTELIEIENKEVRPKAIVKIESENIYSEYTIFGLRWTKRKIGSIEGMEKRNYFHINPLERKFSNIANTNTYIKNNNILVNDKNEIKIYSRYANIYCHTNSFNLIKTDMIKEPTPMEFLISTVLFSKNYRFRKFYKYLPYIETELFKTYMRDLVLIDDRKYYEEAYQVVKDVFEGREYDYYSLPFKLVYNLKKNE